MKVLHAAFMPTPIHGIVNQMHWEQIAARKNNMNWATRLFCPDTTHPSSDLFVAAKAVSSNPAPQMRHRAANWIKLRHEYYQWIKKQAAHYDVVLLRYSSYDAFQTACISGLGRPTYSIHHTLEIPEIRHSNRVLIRSAQIGIENFFGKKTLKEAAGLIGVTDEIVRYEKNRINDQNKAAYVYPNGVYYPDEKHKEIIDSRRSVPELLFVASHFADWHGLDLLLESLRNSRSNFILHLVGSLNRQDQAEAAGDSRIKTYGILTSAEIGLLSQKCWLGLSSFALHRKGMLQACTLKVRDYLMNGLPVYANYHDVFPAAFPFYKVGPPDIEKILEYAWLMRTATRADVSGQSESYISKTCLVSALHDWLKAMHS